MSRKCAARYFAALVVSCLFIILQPSILVCQTKMDTSIAGMWQGTLEFNNNKIRVVFRVAITDTGKLAASLDSPDQGAKGIPASVVFVTKDSVRILVESIGGLYAGKRSADDSSITGKWTQGGGSLPLTMVRTTAEIKYVRPQEPKPPFPYKSEEISFGSELTGMKYSGTLTYPDSGGPFPAAILITGSGAHDRDEYIFGHKPFLVIADCLTKRGIAVLRVDDRGVGGSTGDKMAVSTVEHAQDVIAEMQYLKSRSEIDSSEIGLIGHSEGGIIAPMVAAKSKSVAFVVLLAGTGMRGEKIIVDQTRLMLKSEGVPDSQIVKITSEQENEFRIMGISSDSVMVVDSLKSYLRANITQWAGNGANKDPEKAIDGKIKWLLSPWYHYFLFHDPQNDLERVKCPLLAMDGTLDLQVPGKENLDEIEKALKKGGSGDFTIKLLPGLNHLFQNAKTGDESEYAQIEETFSTEALSIMGNWIVEKTGNK